MTTATVPITVTPEAAAFVRDKSYERVLEQLLEHTIQVVPGLRSLRVALEPDYTCGGEYVNIEANRDPVPPKVHDRTDMEWLQWRDEILPLEERFLFALTSYYEDAHGR